MTQSSLPAPDSGHLGLIWGKAIAFADPPAKVTATSDDGAIDERLAERHGPRHGIEERGRHLFTVLHSGADGRGRAEVILSAEPDVTPLMRFQNMLLAPFVPEQQL